MSIEFQLLISSIIAIIAVYWVFLRLVNVAKKKDFTDHPNSRKLQKTPVPVMGGIAVFFGLMVSMLVFVALNNFWPYNYIHTPLLPVALCALIILYVGFLDDIFGLSPKSRIIIEIFVILGLIYGTGMCMDSLHGLWGIEQLSWWIAIPLTIFASIGIINAYNMVDGINGLSSGLCIVGSSLLAIIYWKRGMYTDCALTLCFASSLVAFFVYNVFGNKSKMFIGDSGTMLMGLLVSWFDIRMLSIDLSESLKSLATDGLDLGVVALVLAVSSVPVFDTLRVMTSRIINKKNPIHADNTHLHHAITGMGISHLFTTLYEIFINCFIVVIWYLTYRLGASIETQLYVVIIFSALLIWGTYFFANQFSKKNPNGFQFAQKTYLSQTHWWISIQNWLDKDV